MGFRDRLFVAYAGHVYGSTSTDHIRYGATGRQRSINRHCDRHLRAGAGYLSNSLWAAVAVMALLSDLTREQNRTKAMAFIGVSFGITFAIAMVLGPIVTHSLGLNALFWMIAALATLGILLTIWVVPNSTNHVLNRESGMVKGCRPARPACRCRFPCRRTLEGVSGNHGDRLCRRRAFYYLC